MKLEIKLKDYKECLGKKQTIMKFQQMFRNEAHNVFTEKVNKIALSTNDKVMQTNAVLIDSSHIYMVQDLV